MVTSGVVKAAPLSLRSATVRTIRFSACRGYSSCLIRTSCMSSGNGSSVDGSSDEVLRTISANGEVSVMVVNGTNLVRGTCH